MGVIVQHRVREFFARCSGSVTTAEQGRALEDLVCYIFEATPGIIDTVRNVRNVFETEEIDVGFWNDSHRGGFKFLPEVLLVECKNWSRPVGSQEVAYFVRRLQNRNLDIGILIAANGITGSPTELTAARFEIATALKDGIRVLVIDRAEIEQLSHSNDLVQLVRRKLFQLQTTQSCF